MVSPTISSIPQRTTGEPRSGNAARSRPSRMSTARKLRPGHREATCGFRPSAGLRSVQFMRRSTGEIRADGCHACGSVWTCPRCAARITETRCADLQAATRAWIQAGNCVAMVTLTVPHTANEGLESLSVRLRDAMKRLRGGGWKTATAMCEGFVRASEITYGSDNGWHPHFHILLFVRGPLADLDAIELQLQISKSWQRAAVAAGFSEPDQRIGCNVVLGVTVEERLAAYLAKWAHEPEESEREALSRRQWGAERELAKWHTKRSKGERLTPFEILDAYAIATTKAERERLLALWLEYASAMRGARQLVWSRGLKKHLQTLGVQFDERTDQELADAEAIAADETAVAEVSVEEWRWLVGFKLAEALVSALQKCPSQATVTGFVNQVRDRREALRRQRWQRLDDPTLFDLTFTASVN